MATLNKNMQDGGAPSNLSLEKQRDVVENGEEHNEGDRSPRQGEGSHLASQRVADGDVSVDRDQDHDPDRDHL